MISFSRHYRESSISILIYSLLPAEKEMQYSQRVLLLKPDASNTAMMIGVRMSSESALANKAHSR